LALLSVAAFASAGEAESDLTVEAQGLRLVAKATSNDESLRPFGSQPGTSVALRIASAAGGLIQFDSESSTISRFTDDKGNDLLARATSKKTNVTGEVVDVVELAGFGMFPKISKDGKSCALEVLAPNLPAKGCTRMKLEGVITMLCASQKNEQAIKDVAVKNGTKIAAPGLDLTLDNVGKPDFGEDPFSVTVRSHSKLDNVAEIRFFKADGSEIKSHQTGTSKMAILGSLTVEWTYSLAEKADVATVKIFSWADMQKKKVAFKLDVDVGL
jgi:hypothetical protein